MEDRKRTGDARAWVCARAVQWVTIALLGCANDPAAEPDGEPPQPAVEVKNQALPVDAYASYAQAAPTIDGLPNEQVWTSTGEWSVNRTIVGSVSGTFDSYANWRAVWDASALYLLVRVEDDRSVNDSTLPWEDDSIEIYIDADLSRDDTYGRDDYQLVIGWNDTTVVEAHGKSVPGVAFARSDFDGGSHYEVKIPWSSLNGMQALPYRAIGLDVHLNDDDDGGARDAKHSWYAMIDSSWADPRTFGTLMLYSSQWPICPDDYYFPYRILRAQVAPVIDGKEDASGAYGYTWLNGAYMTIGGTYASYPDLSAVWRLAWDPSYLYLFVEVYDEAQRNDSTYPWDDDSVELYLDGDYGRSPTYQADDMQLVFGWGDTTVVEPHGHATTGVTFASRPLPSTPGGYGIEARIPWSLIGGGGPVHGRPIGIDVHVNDDDDGGGRDTKVSSYAAQDTAWADPRVFGTGGIIVCTTPQ